MPADREAPFPELRRLFSWRDAAGHEARCAALARARLVAVASAINQRLDGDVRAELERLPDEGYLSILRGPDTCFAALHGAPEDLARSVARWIVVERAVLGEPAPALARAEPPASGSLRAAGCHLHVELAEGRVTEVRALPRIAGARIALDFTSELPSRLSTRFPERVLVPPGLEERELAAAKLADALALLDQVSPLASDLVRRMIDVICCRTSCGDDRFYTASDQTTLGVVHLVNAHLARKTTAEIASELVHEAIHQAVFCRELTQPLLDDPELGLEKVSSLWTGARLDLYAFLHACFVWYGVASLWRLSTVPLLPAVGRQLRTAEVGFERRPLSTLGALADRLPRGLRDAIDDMTREIARA